MHILLKHNISIVCYNLALPRYFSVVDNTLSWVNDTFKYVYIVLSH